MVIYDTFGNVILDIEVDDTSVAYEALKADSTLTLKYSLDRHVEVPLGAFCTFEGKTYSLMAPEDVTMHNRRNFEYTLVMHSDAAKAKRYMFVNPVDGRLKFSLTATPREHLQMFVDNMNKRDSGWSIGECEDHVEIVLSYNHTYCHDALVQLADERKLDYWFDGKKVSLGKLELNKDNPLALSYGGDGAGLKSGTKRVNYSNALPIEVLYVQGTNVNIDPSRYGAAELHLPKSVQIGYDGAHFSDESGYNSGSARWYKTDDKGSSVRRADKQQTTYAEDSLDCTEIEPTQELTVLDVLATDAEKHFYDIMVYSDFDYNDYIIAGEKPTIVFQSGELAGKEFDLATDKDGNLVRRHPSGFTENYWVFEIVPQEIDGITMPDAASGFMVKRNDTFKIFGIQLPDEYISNASAKSGAEWDMLRYAIKYLYANEDQQFTLTGELDEIYAKRNWAGIRDRIALGSYVSFYDRSFQQEPVLIRIIGIKRFVNKPYSPVIEISNSVVGGTLLGTINRIQNQEVYNEEMYRQGINYTKRRWRDAREAMDMLEQAMLTGFTDAISPITVQAMSMLVGDESLQFRFVDSIDEPDTVSPTIRYDKLTKKVLSSGDIIQHMTLGIESVSNTHAANEYKYWNVAASESDITDADKAYYVYIRASKSSMSAEFVISEEAIEMESEAGYYHFLTGILNRESEADRSFVSLYGFTEVLPGQITTDIIRDADSNLIIDLLNATITARNGAKIIGDVEFGTNSSGLSNLSEWQTLESEAAEATKIASEASRLNLLANSAELVIAATGSNTYKVLGLPITISTGDEFTFKSENIERLAGTINLVAVRMLSPDLQTTYASNTVGLGENKVLTFKITTEGVSNAKAVFLLYAGTVNGTTGNTIRYTNFSLVKGATAMATWEDYQGDNGLKNLLSTAVRGGDSKNFTITAGESEANQHGYFTLPKVYAGETYTFMCDTSTLSSGSEYNLYLYKYIDSVLTSFTSPALYTMKVGSKQWGTLNVIRDGEDVHLGIYAGINGATNGKTLKLTNISLVRGSRPMMVWKENTDYLTNAFKNGTTKISGGLVMAQAVAVTNDAGTVKGMFNGSETFNDATHGTLMLAAGSEGATKDQLAAATTRIYEDGTIKTSSLIAKQADIEGAIKATSFRSEMADCLIEAIANGFMIAHESADSSVHIGPGSITISDFQSTLATACILSQTGLTFPKGIESVITLYNGFFKGLRPYTRDISSGDTLSELDHNVFITGGTIYLPASPLKGQTYKIYHYSTTALTINGGGKNILQMKGSSLPSGATVTSSQIEVIELVYGGVNWYATINRWE